MTEPGSPSTIPTSPPRVSTLETALAWAGEGRAVALATVIETWGSAPRPAGSHLVIDEEGRFEGSVSGGCVEGSVVAEAVEVIETGEPRLLDFGVADETAWRVGLSCGGRIRVFVQKLGTGFALQDLARLTHARRARCPALLSIDLSAGETSVVLEGEAGWPATDDKRPARLEGDLFLNLYRPAPRLVVVGAVHISQALTPMARLAGFDVTIIDPRTAFATPERFQGADLIAEWPDEVFPARPLDRQTALIAVTHDPKIDDPALIAALDAGCFYIGVLGSRKTHASRLERLQQAGFSDSALSTIHAPIGLPIQAATPAEIAVAILAELIATLRSPTVPTTIAA